MCMCLFLKGYFAKSWICFKLSESSKQVYSNKESHSKGNKALSSGDLLARCVL